MPGGIDGTSHGLGPGAIGRTDDGFAVMHERPAPAQTNLIATATERPRAHSQQQRAGASSYWSVQEQNDFKRYVTYYGTDFATISSLLGTKTHIMVSLHSLTG